jgi:hypothetical protein
VRLLAQATLKDERNANSGHRRVGHFLTALGRLWSIPSIIITKCIEKAKASVIIPARITKKA